MAHSLSAKKRVRQNDKRRMRNRAERATLKTTLKKVTETLTATNLALAETQLQVAIRALDQQAGAKLIHKNEAARRKSRLTLKLNALKKKA